MEAVRYSELLLPYHNTTERHTLLLIEAVKYSELLLPYHNNTERHTSLLPEDGSSEVPRNVSILPHHYTVS